MIHRYQRITTPGPDGSTLYFNNADGELRAIELCEIDGWHYVSVPDGLELPDQPPEIQWQPVVLDTVLRERIKGSSRACLLIAEGTQQRIRARYSGEDELYFARIGTGHALGAYQFEPGEHEALLEYGAYVESVRQWARAQRAGLGL